MLQLDTVGAEDWKAVVDVFFKPRNMWNTYYRDKGKMIFYWLQVYSLADNKDTEKKGRNLNFKFPEGRCHWSDCDEYRVQILGIY